MGIEKSAYLVFDKVCSDSCLSEVPGTNGRRQRIKLARWSWDTAIPQCRLYTGQSYMSIAKKRSTGTVLAGVIPKLRQTMDTAGTVDAKHVRKKKQQADPRDKKEAKGILIIMQIQIDG